MTDLLGHLTTIRDATWLWLTALLELRSIFWLHHHPHRPGNTRLQNFAIACLRDSHSALRACSCDLQDNLNALREKAPSVVDRRGHAHKRLLMCTHSLDFQENAKSNLLEEFVAGKAPAFSNASLDSRQLLFDERPGKVLFRNYRSDQGPLDGERRIIESHATCCARGVELRGHVVHFHAILQRLVSVRAALG